MPNQAETTLVKDYWVFSQTYQYFISFLQKRLLQLLQNIRNKMSLLEDRNKGVSKNNKDKCSATLQSLVSVTVFHIGTVIDQHISAFYPKQGIHFSSTFVTHSLGHLEIKALKIIF